MNSDEVVLSNSEFQGNGIKDPTLESNLISILMPAYNGERFIKQAIESVLDQTYPFWELIIVDDGSTDRTAEVVAAFKDSRIRYEYQMNTGQAAALNRGLELARGEFITTLDVDDWYTPNSLQDRVVFLNENPECDVVYGDGYYCDVNGKPLMRFSENRIGDVVGDVYDVLITSPFFGTGGNVLIRRQVIDSCQFRYDESILWCQDWDFYVRIAENSTFGCVNTILIWYRIYEGNMTTASELGERRRTSFFRMKSKILDSKKFSQSPTSTQVTFIDDFLLHGLYNRIGDQTAFILTDQFQALPKSKQAFLLCNVAIFYMLRTEHLEFAKDMISNAWALDPFDLRTVILYLSMRLDIKFAEAVIRLRKQLGRNQDSMKSPFEMTRNIQ